MPDEVATPKRGRPPKGPSPESLALQAWQAQPECPYCHARPGYNPSNGVWIRSWNAATREYVEGHRAHCKTLMVDPRSQVR